MPCRPYSRGTGSEGVFNLVILSELTAQTDLERGWSGLLGRSISGCSAEALGPTRQ